MAFRDLQEFIKALNKIGELKTINTEVSSELEVTEIADRVSKAHGPALQFNRVKNSNYPLVINTMGTYERLAFSFGVKHMDEIAEEIASLITLSKYATLKDKIMAIPKLLPLIFIFPVKTLRKAPCQQVVESPNLDTLPILKCWPEDGGKYITLPLVFTKDPETNQQNVGMYRLQVFDHQTTGMHWHLHKDGRTIYDKYRKLGRRMPVSVAIGCDPTLIFAATAPLPKMIDEMIFAGFLKKRPVPMTKCITNDILVPANAEFILEGYVALDELRPEGPFGDHTGYYSLTDDYPVFHIEKITRKKNPIYPTTIVGKPPMEDCYLGKATERIFLPLLKLQCPEIVDINFPLEGVFHNCVIVSIKKSYPLHGKKVLNAIWGLGQMMYTKLIVVVSEGIDISDYKRVLQEVITHASLKNHFVISEGPLDALDHASNKPLQGFRLGIDATVKRADEVKGTRYSELAVSHILANIGSGYIKCIPFDKDKFGSAQKYLRNHSSEAQVLILLDHYINPKDLSTVAWKLFNNIDANRDIIINECENGHLFIGIDATKKGPRDGHLRPWPNDIEMDEKTKKHVTERWPSYGIDL